jgi:hypothetical protein
MSPTPVASVCVVAHGIATSRCHRNVACLPSWGAEAAGTGARGVRSPRDTNAKRKRSVDMRRERIMRFWHDGERTVTVDCDVRGRMVRSFRCRHAARVRTGA